MQTKSYWLLVLCLTLALAADAPLTGRWLFQGLSDSGKKVPLFIIDFPASGKATIVSTTAPFELQVKDFSLQGDSLTLNLTADGQPLNLKGTLANGVMTGKTSGQALNGFSFVAERTDRAELARLKPPVPEELEAFQTARDLPDPQKKIDALHAFLDKYPTTSLKTSALLETLDAGLEANQPDDKLVPVMTQAIESTDDKAVVMNDIAFRLAEKNRTLQKAEEYARGATEMAKPGSAAKGNFLDTLGWVLYRQGKLDDAVSTLREALKTSPREGDIALHLAEVLEKQGKTDEVTEAYLQAYVGGGNRQARNTAREMYRKQKGSLEGFHELTDKLYASLPPLFEAGHFDGEYSGPAVVAELFTGAQCGPCQAADYAFDGLITRFPETTVNVLEYHIHVPAPDPMTTPDTMARARFYQIRSTPVALFSGSERRQGGGPMVRSEMAFREYLDAINPQLKSGNKTRVDLQAKSDKDTISVNGKVGLASLAAGDDLRLFIALVEKTVHYTGSNGVHLHHNVVRKLLNGNEGTRITAADFDFKQTASVPAIEAEIKQYLDQLAKEWGMGFDDAPMTLNRGELAVVAFVQNAQTYQILGSAMVPVK